MVGTRAPGAYFFSFLAGAGEDAAGAGAGAGAGSGAGAETGAEAGFAGVGALTLVVVAGGAATGVRRVVVVGVWMGTVREADVLAWTLVEEGMTEDRTLVTPDVSVGMPRAALSSADLRMARLM